MGNIGHVVSLWRLQIVRTTSATFIEWFSWNFVRRFIKLWNRSANKMVQVALVVSKWRSLKVWAFLITHDNVARCRLCLQQESWPLQGAPNIMQCSPFRVIGHYISDGILDVMEAPGYGQDKTAPLYPRFSSLFLAPQEHRNRIRGCCLWCEHYFACTYRRCGHIFGIIPQVRRKIVSRETWAGCKAISWGLRKVWCWGSSEVAPRGNVLVYTPVSEVNANSF